ncbi:dTMP kinase [bacterium]|nr:dTMP kinase [bacterium]
MKKNIYQGKFIVFEGLDGSGLSTQAKLLKEYLENRGIKTVLTKEPTKNSSIASKIHQALSHQIEIDSLQLQRLFAQDRREHLENLIIPSLKEGKFVISDRYFFSSFAFGSEKEEDLEKIIELNKDFLMPDLVLLLKVRPKVCIERIKKRGEEIKLFEKEEKLEKVWKNYQKLVDMFDVIKVIDGEQEIDKVQREVVGIVDKMI